MPLTSVPYTIKVIMHTADGDAEMGAIDVSNGADYVRLGLEPRLRKLILDAEKFLAYLQSEGFDAVPNDGFSGMEPRP